MKEGKESEIPKWRGRGGGEGEEDRKLRERDRKVHFLKNISTDIYFRPDWVELLPWAYPTDNMTFPTQSGRKEEEKIANEVLPPTTTKIFKRQSRNSSKGIP